KQAFASERVGHPAEYQGAKHRTADIQGACPPHLGCRQRQCFGALQHASEGAHQRDLQAVEHPGNAQRQYDASMPARPCQIIETRSDILKRALSALMHGSHEVWFPHGTMPQLLENIESERCHEQIPYTPSSGVLK